MPPGIQGLAHCIPALQEAVKNENTEYNNLHNVVLGGGAHGRAKSDSGLICNARAAKDFAFWDCEGGGENSWILPTWPLKNTEYNTSQQYFEITTAAQTLSIFATCSLPHLHSALELHWAAGGQERMDCMGHMGVGTASASAGFGEVVGLVAGAQTSSCVGAGWTGPGLWADVAAGLENAQAVRTAWAAWNVRLEQHDGVNAW